MSEIGLSNLCVDILLKSTDALFYIDLEKGKSNNF